MSARNTSVPLIIIARVGYIPCHSTHSHSIFSVFFICSTFHTQEFARGIIIRAKAPAYYQQKPNNRTVPNNRAL